MRRAYGIEGRFSAKRAATFERIELEIRMDPTGPSIFDLSPAEKLQLVEDLWDDLAGTPEAVPVHDWQKLELARRKANLLKNPASALPWDEVTQRVRRPYGR
ncbi:MAG: addiction module protein [Bryobacteraceae bacterium]|nr:addiction module protein [Bryobacteraceae bacterium]